PWGATGLSVRPLRTLLLLPRVLLRVRVPVRERAELLARLLGPVHRSVPLEAGIRGVPEDVHPLPHPPRTGDGRPVGRHVVDESDTRLLLEGLPRPMADALTGQRRLLAGDEPHVLPDACAGDGVGRATASRILDGPHGVLVLLLPLGCRLPGPLGLEDRDLDETGCALPRRLHHPGIASLAVEHPLPEETHRLGERP